MFHVNSSRLTVYLVCWRIKVFQACVAVNVKTGGMFLRITQKGESIPALVALWCADNRCSLVHVGRALLSSFSVVTSWRLMHGSSQKVIRIELRAYVTHFQYCSSALRTLHAASSSSALSSSNCSRKEIIQNILMDWWPRTSWWIDRKKSYMGKEYFGEADTTGHNPDATKTESENSRHRSRLKRDGNR